MRPTVECRQQSSFWSRRSPYIVNTSCSGSDRARACVSTSQFAGSRTRGWAKLRRRRPRLRRRQHAAVPASRRVPSNYDNVALFLGLASFQRRRLERKYSQRKRSALGMFPRSGAFFVVLFLFLISLVLVKCLIMELYQFSSNGSGMF